MRYDMIVTASRRQQTGTLPVLPQLMEYHMSYLSALVLAVALGVICLSVWLQVIYRESTIYRYDPKPIARLLTAQFAAVLFIALSGYSGS